MRLLTLVLAALVVCAPHALAQGQARAKELRLLAAELPPYTFQIPPASVSETPGADHGLVLEVVSEMARRAGHSGLIEFMPWGEAQRLAQTQPNIGILALTRTPEREERYRWLARIVTDDLILVGGQGIDVSSLDRVRERPVGVLSRSGAEALLRERGFHRIKAQPEEWMNARLMQQRRDRSPERDLSRGIKGFAGRRGAEMGEGTGDDESRWQLPADRRRVQSPADRADPR